MWLILSLACRRADDVPPSVAPAPPTHASALALDEDAGLLYAANADADTIAVIDVDAGALLDEIPLGDGPPAVAADGSFTPPVAPRSVASSADGRTLWVAAWRAGAVLVVDPEARAVRGTIPVGSEPVAVIVAGGAVFVAVSGESEIARIDPVSLRITGTASLPWAPWGLAFADGVVYATSLVDPGFAAIDAASLDVEVHAGIAPVPRQDDPRIANGVARAAYDLAPAPDGTLWVAHQLAATETPQPELDFETTVFPGLTPISPAGVAGATISTDALDVPGIDGGIGDIVSGPRALALTSDGAYALLVDQASEDVLAIDLASGEEAALLRPLPGNQPEAIALSADGARAWVLERNTGDVAVIDVDRSGGGIALSVAGTIPTMDHDPMPADLRLGQHLFFSADSDELPISRNHWVACASCHPDGRSDAVTWQFLQGPRDTPSNAGGTVGTGFLHRTADRTSVRDYWETVVVEQGGALDPVRDAGLLDALTAYVDHGLPSPVPPRTDPEKVARGRELFASEAVGCATCHSGPRLTDSGAGNPDLDLAGTVLLHDVGTCAPGDADHLAADGSPREACAFDTPSLTGLAASGPWLHDGSAMSLRDALEQTRGTMGDIGGLSDEELDDLVEYLRSL